MPLYIKVKGSFPGKHYWPGAPERFQELGKLHEHVFHFVVEIQEAHPREIEFLEVAQQITQRLSRHLQDHPYLSCEEMARDLFDDFAEGWAAPAGRVVSTEVNEDGGCGATYREDVQPRTKVEAHFADPNIQALYKLGRNLMDKGLL